MSIITLEEYNNIVGVTYDENSAKLIKKLDEGTIVTINAIWKEYHNYFSTINCTGKTEIEIEETSF
tara:strand:+ start:1340 stop:1537 length:198 start_codon:yes stop_codon:yes gene_type:complete